MALVRVRLDDGTETSVSESFAASHKLKVLDKPSFHKGRTLRAKYPVDLRGKALDDALELAGLPKTGSAAEKRERLSEHQASPAFSGDESSGNAATSDEESA